jgi:hypothetical protein
VFQVLSVNIYIFLIVRRNERDMVIMYIRLHVKFSLFLLAFNKFEFPRLILEKWLYSTFYANPSSGSWTDGQANAKRLLVAFCNAAKAPRN